MLAAKLFAGSSSYGCASDGEQTYSFLNSGADKSMQLATDNQTVCTTAQNLAEVEPSAIHVCPQIDRRKLCRRGRGRLLRLLSLSVLFCVPVQLAAASEFVDLFKGDTIAMPDGSRKLYPDRKKWAFTLASGLKYPNSFGDGTNWLQANGECQVYLSPFTITNGKRTIPIDQRYDPFTIEDDGLHIRAAVLNDQQRATYQLKSFQRFGSGILISRMHFEQGHVEIVAKLPSARGTWPAFWLLPADGAWPPEIDLMEGMDWGRHASELHAGMIAPDPKQTFADWFKLRADPSQAMHTYALNWSSAALTVSFDGVKLWSKPTPQSVNRPMYLLINLAVGGTWVYNELGVRPIGSTAEDRLAKGSDSIIADYPADLVVRSVKVSSPTMTE